MPNLGGDDALLEKAIKDLHAAWDVAGEGWRDLARDDFKDRHLDGMEAEVRGAARAMRELQVLIAEAVRSCS